MLRSTSIQLYLVILFSYPTSSGTILSISRMKAWLQIFCIYTITQWSKTKTTTNTLSVTVLKVPSGVMWTISTSTFSISSTWKKNLIISIQFQAMMTVILNLLKLQWILKYHLEMGRKFKLVETANQYWMIRPHHPTGSRNLQTKTQKILRKERKKRKSQEKEKVILQGIHPKIRKKVISKMIYQALTKVRLNWRIRGHLL